MHTVPMPGFAESNIRTAINATKRLERSLQTPSAPGSVPIILHGREKRMDAVI